MNFSRLGDLSETEKKRNERILKRSQALLQCKIFLTKTGGKRRKTDGSLQIFFLSFLFSHNLSFLFFSFLSSTHKLASFHCLDFMKWNYCSNCLYVWTKMDFVLVRGNYLSFCFRWCFKCSWRRNWGWQVPFGWV